MSIIAEESNPLASIETAVQERAKAERLDLSRAEGRRRLEALVADEVSQWNLDHRRGLRSFPLSDTETVTQRALRNLVGYGPLDPLLADDDVWEIMVNAPDAIFVKRHRGTSGLHGEIFHDDEHVLRTVTKILDDASVSHRKLDPAEGLQDAQLEDGSRVHIVHGDLSRGGHLMVNIRKFTGVTTVFIDSQSGRCDLRTNQQVRRRWAVPRCSAARALVPRSRPVSQVERGGRIRG